jgi:hypothetical protein
MAAGWLYLFDRGPSSFASLLFSNFALKYFIGLSKKILEALI